MGEQILGRAWGGAKEGKGVEEREGDGEEGATEGA